MKRQAGFSLIEVLVAIAILVTVVGLAVGALLQAQSAATVVSYEANTQENLRAGMHFIVRDLTQAGEGIPQGGISVPNTGANSTIHRPGTATTFMYNGTGVTALPPIMPGSLMGAQATTVNPATNTVLTGNNTDIINILYADNTLVDSHGYQTNTYPVYQALNPTCNGVISPTGAFVTMDANCFTMPGLTQPITAGNLIMLHNQNGTAIEYVTSVAGQTINFAGGDPAGLNQTGLTSGTVYALQTFNGSGAPTGFPSTSITRVWMVTYYLDTTTNPSKPMLVRQVNYPNYPAGAPANPPQQIADSIEYLTFSYDITSSVASAGTYPLGAGNAATPVSPDVPTQIRAVNVFLAGRSEYSYKTQETAAYMHNNLMTQVCPRSLSFQNLFQTSATQTSP
ncbi:MAG: prepilin-type N-terminal cleavage/methylation domain-containing protein [Candidatus Acidiferrales bacterium]